MFYLNAKKYFTLILGDLGQQSTQNPLTKLLLNLTIFQNVHFDARPSLELMETSVCCDSAQIASLAPSNATNELSLCNRDSSLELSVAHFLDSNCDCLTRG